ncbi:hypothetical protein CLU79DRAFT_757630 [Phycomyces nitens]|nr:hypothetical protein CLU79DRAFT_757630 [Phycomyces nitens]
MFVPTIKYKKVSDKDKEPERDVNVAQMTRRLETVSLTKPIITQSAFVVPTTTPKPVQNNVAAEDPKINKTQDPDPKVKSEDESVVDPSNEVDPSIEVDPTDKERIVITLSTGKQYKADRYCPHAGADLTYHGIIGENDYPPEIGPILTCGIHYWEFVLNRQGDGHNGRASIDACPVTCKSGSSKLEW